MKKEEGVMKKNLVVIFTVILTITIGMATVFAAGPDVSGTTSVGVFSNYVWRGQKLSNSFVIQPSVGITYNGFGANLWANYDSDYNNHGEHTETDLTLDYSFNYDRLSFDAGYIYYGLEGADDTQEVYLSVSYDMLLNPTLTVYYDFDEGDGGFVVASVGHDFQLPYKTTLSLGASASYNLNNKVMGYDSGGDDFSNFYNAELSASLSIPVFKAVTLEPSIAYSFPLSSDAEDALQGISDDGDDDIIYGGVTITLSF